MRPVIKMKIIPTLLNILCLCALTVAAADKAKEDTYQGPPQANPAYLIQGEYTAVKLGAQVIALGGGKFRAVLHHGGLPGAGWDKSAKIEIEGTGAARKAVFPGAGWSADIVGDTLTARTDKGASFELKKIARKSPTLGAQPPAGATVLFDGTSAEAWTNGKMDDQKSLRCGTRTKEKFGSFTLHIEFLLPFQPADRGQGRGNSGVYFQDRYEVQVLDSFGLKGENNECGGIYSKHKPALNMCLPPLVWQTYDVEFEAAKFDADGKKSAAATLTVRHNGVLIHDRAEVSGTTTASGINTETPTPGPIQLQDHGNPVYYRNIWLVPKK